MRNATAHARSGRPADPNALRRERRDDKTEWFTLPAEGRQGDAPEWPLDRPSEREKTIWARLWAMPQAVAWEAGHFTDTVAFYTRAFRIAETDEAKAADRTLVKQYQDTLGLTEAGMRSNRWRIDNNTAQAAPEKSDAPRRAAAKARFRTIEGGAAAAS